MQVAEAWQGQKSLVGTVGTGPQEWSWTISLMTDGVIHSGWTVFRIMTNTCWGIVKHIFDIHQMGLI